MHSAIQYIEDFSFSAFPSTAGIPFHLAVPLKILLEDGRRRIGSSERIQKILDIAIIIASSTLSLVSCVCVYWTARWRAARE